MLGSTVVTHAKAAGFTVDRCLSMAKASEKLGATDYPVVVVELVLNGLDISQLKESCGSAAVLGFAGHVRTDLINQAEACGMSFVTNGQMHSQGEAIFRNLRQRLDGES